MTITRLRHRRSLLVLQIATGLAAIAAYHYATARSDSAVELRNEWFGTPIERDAVRRRTALLNGIGEPNVDIESWNDIQTDPKVMELLR